MSITSKKIIGYRFTPIKRWFREPRLGLLIQWEIEGTFEDYDLMGSYVTVLNYPSPIWHHAKTGDLIELYKFMEGLDE